MNPTLVQPYLFFGGKCDEALAFYGKSLGAKVEFLMRNSESPEPLPPGMMPPGFEHKVMHATITIGGSTIMVSDGNEIGPKFSGFNLSLNFPTEVEARRAFTALAEDGSIDMPLAKTFWSPCFGMVTDHFGICWMISVPGQNA